MTKQLGAGAGGTNPLKISSAVVDGDLPTQGRPSSPADLSEWDVQAVVGALLEIRNCGLHADRARAVLASFGLDYATAAKLIRRRRRRRS